MYLLWDFLEFFGGLPVGFLINDILTKSPRSPPKSYKKNQGKNPYNIFVAILVEMMIPKRHFEIN